MPQEMLMTKTVAAVQVLEDSTVVKRPTQAKKCWKVHRASQVTPFSQLRPRPARKFSQIFVLSCLTKAVRGASIPCYSEAGLAAAQYLCSAWSEQPANPSCCLQLAVGMQPCCALLLLILAQLASRATADIYLYGARHEVVSHQKLRS